MHRTSGRLHSMRLVLVLILLLILTGCSNSQEEKKQDSAGRENAAWDGALTHDISAQLVYTHSMQKDHAQQFSVDYYEDGYALITLCDGSQFLSVPEGRDGQPPAVPEDLPERITVLQQPVGNIYLAASAAMDMFRAMDALDCITLSGIEQNSWHIEEAREAMEQGRITYAGKYSAPDYELIKAKGCTLSIQSTMLEHVPEVREQLELLGIHVFEDHSSY
ncbi:MAG: ABC transporter substrate-binding protein, partial [Lachnospiraceae bacterium]|nr:ABC transporter substrate-binding protein [Lachnospiraceae bacterium]